jgi:flagellar hook protein FlgE
MDTQMIVSKREIIIFTIGITVGFSVAKLFMPTVKTRVETKEVLVENKKEDKQVVVAIETKQNEQKNIVRHITTYSETGHVVSKEIIVDRSKEIKKNSAKQDVKIAADTNTYAEKDSKFSQEISSLPSWQIGVLLSPMDIAKQNYTDFSVMVGYRLIFGVSVIAQIDSRFERPMVGFSYQF